MLRRSFLACLVPGARHRRARRPVRRPTRARLHAEGRAGKTVKLSDFRGKHVVLEWTNPGCPYVRKHYDSGNMPGHAAGRDRQGRGLAVDQFHREVQQRLPRAGQAGGLAEGPQVQPTAMLMDEEGTAGKAYGARTTPHMYIVDPQGKLVYAGGIDSIPSSNPDDIRKATNYVKVGLDEALAGKPITTAASRPYGCSIKYKG
jgi:hypothetical protein